jgi:hypothetical protein
MLVQSLKFKCFEKKGRRTKSKMFAKILTVSLNAAPLEKSEYMIKERRRIGSPPRL